MHMTEYTNTLDVKGENCPMPVIKTKQKIDNLTSGDVLRIIATDSGSVSDIKGWAENTDDVELIEQVEEDNLYTHYIKRTK